jgi:hypothetical protein
MHSIAWPASGLGSELQQRHHNGQADMIHLHWLGDGTLSIEEIGHLSVPLVWTLHDQWAFCGAEHYTWPPLPGESVSSDELFALGYSPESHPSHESGPDLNYSVWLFNGVIIEQHEESMRYRQAIADMIVPENSCRVLDFGGGIGTLARCIAQRSSQIQVEVLDPFAPRHDIESCYPFKNIQFVSDHSTSA